jgi:hypothetical protein
VVVGGYRDFFVVIATSSATLIGLLFVAISVADSRTNAHPQVIREFRAAASLLAFTNAFSVSLFGLVPGNAIGYPAAIVGIIGLFFMAAGVRSILSLPSRQQHRRSQSVLIVSLLVMFGFQLAFGIELLIHPNQRGALAALGDVLIVSLLIGIGRAWELVGQLDAGIISSIRVLIGRPPRTQGIINPEVPTESHLPLEQQ